MKTVLTKPAKFAGGGYITPFFDVERTESFNKAFSQNVNASETVLEIGAGNGALSILASKYAKQVISLEDDPSFLRILEETTKSLKEKNLKVKEVDNLFNYEPTEIFDNLICEMVSPGLLLQPQQPMIDKYLRYLKKKGNVFPCAITNCVTLVDSELSPYNIPFKFAYRERMDLPHAQPVSTKAMFNHIRFDNEIGTVSQGCCDITALVSGVSNSIRIETVIYTSEDTILSDTKILCPPLVVPLENEIHLEGGSNYQITGKFFHAQDLSDQPKLIIDIQKK